MRRTARRQGRIGGRTWLIAAGVALVVLTAAVVVWVAFFREDQPNGPFRDVEFRILASAPDDGDALNAAGDYLKEAKTNPERQAELDRSAREGKPPSCPNQGYAWVELGPSEVRSLRAVPEAPGALDQWQRLWKEADDARDKGEPFLFPGSSMKSEKFLSDKFLYSRPTANATHSSGEGEEKKYDYFYLTRLPEPGKELTGERLRVVKAMRDRNGKPCLSIETTKEGGDLMYEISSKNADHRLALIIRGEIVTAPIINFAFRTKSQISSHFSEAEVNALVAAIRGIPPKP